MSISKEKFSEIITSIPELSEDQFTSVKALINKRTKDIRKEKISEWKEELQEGKKYKLSNGEVAEVLKVKRTRFLGIINGSKYNINISMVVGEV